MALPQPCLNLGLRPARLARAARPKSSQRPTNSDILGTVSAEPSSPEALIIRVFQLFSKICRNATACTGQNRDLKPRAPGPHGPYTSANRVWARLVARGPRGLGAPTTVRRGASTSTARREPRTHAWPRVGGPGAARAVRLRAFGAPNPPLARARSAAAAARAGPSHKKFSFGRAG